MKKMLHMNLMRICIGTPDFTGDAEYSYCDLPEGETDTLLKAFSFAKDEQYILPILREACCINLNQQLGQKKVNQSIGQSPAARI